MDNESKIINAARLVLGADKLLVEALESLKVVDQVYDVKRYINDIKAARNHLANQGWR